MWRHDLDMGCVSCSLEADHAEGALVHLENHDVSYVRVSRAPLAKLEAYKKRLGWKAKWVSSYANDFNFDYHVSFSDAEMAKDKLYYNYQMIKNEFGVNELPGLSVFFKDKDGAIYHTYSSYARGNEEVIGAFIYLDITPKGRNEKEIMEWVKRNDEYGAAPQAPSCCHSTSQAKSPEPRLPTPKKESTMALSAQKIVPCLVVRQGSRGGRKPLRLDIQELADLECQPLRQGGLRNPRTRSRLGDDH